MEQVFPGCGFGLRERKQERQGDGGGVVAYKRATGQEGCEQQEAARSRRERSGTGWLRVGQECWRVCWALVGKFEGKSSQLGREGVRRVLILERSWSHRPRSNLPMQRRQANDIACPASFSRRLLIAMFSSRFSRVAALAPHQSAPSHCPRCTAGLRVRDLSHPDQAELARVQRLP